MGIRRRSSSISTSESHALPGSGVPVELMLHCVPPQGATLSVASARMNTMGHALSLFSPATREWFEGAFAEPTPVQDGAWRAIAGGGHALVVAPTGSGKTLAAFLWAIDRLSAEASA